MGLASPAGRGNPWESDLRILLAVHDSKFCEIATSALIAQVKANGTEIRVLHVLEEFPLSLAEQLGSKEFPEFTRARLELKKEAKVFLEQAMRKFRSAGFETSEVLQEGYPLEIILEQAEIWPADVIVVGSHGRKGIKRFLMGSTSESVARYARCSVQILRTRHEH